MKFRAYIKIIMPFIFIFSVSFHISSKEIETKINESPDSIRETTVNAEVDLFELPADSLEQPVQTRACVNTFTNQTVSTYLGVEGCSALAVQNVTVISNGDLILWGEVTINGPFDVLLGGKLEVNITKPLPPPANFTYTYDASGNRISRTY